MVCWPLREHGPGYAGETVQQGTPWPRNAAPGSGWDLLSPEERHLGRLEGSRSPTGVGRSEAEPCHSVAAEDTALLLVGQARDGRHQAHRLGELTVPVGVVRGIHGQVLAHGLEHVGEDGLFRLAGEGNLATANDLRGF